MVDQVSTTIGRRAARWADAVRRSLFRIGWPRTDKDRAAAMISSLFLHIHSAKVRRRSLRFRTTLGLGFLAASAFIILVVTGIVLTVYYVPHPAEAYRSMQDLRSSVSFGWLFRNMHRWAAHAMVALVLFHLCRVFYTGAYKPPREFNWVIGATYSGMPETAAPVRNLWTVNMSVRRDVFDEIQGFRTGFGKVGKISSPEDTDFCIRAIQCRPEEIWLYRPKAKVRHKVPASRANWKFYLWRCFNEGFGKAELSSLVGGKQGMSAERNHMLYTLPTGFAKGLGDALFRRDSSGFGRAVAILLGLAAAITGYSAGMVSGLLPRQAVGDA